MMRRICGRYAGGLRVWCTGVGGTGLILPVEAGGEEGPGIR